MKENLAGLVKILGISILLLVLWALLSYYVPDNFLKTSNIQNLMDRTALFGILGIGVAFVVISSGIDLSIGSLVCFAACLLATFLHVSHHPMEFNAAWELEKETRTLVVDATQDYQVGQQLFYDGKREKKLFEIESIADSGTTGPEGTPRVQLTLVKGPRRSRTSDDGEPIGGLSPVYSIESVEGENRLTLTDKSLVGRLNVKDQVKLVHPTKSRTEKTISGLEVNEAGQLVLELDNNHRGLSTEYLVVPQKRWVPMSITTALITILAIGLAIGLFHGFLITKWNQRPFIVTLCGLLIYRGLSRWITKDQPYGFAEYTEEFGWISSGRWILWEAADKTDSFGIPYTVFFFVAITIAAIIVLNFSVWGRHLLAVGRNEEAARFSGINTKRVTLIAYVICALLAAVGGIFFAIDSGSVTPSSFGEFYELYAIAAVVLGGCSLRGGEGSIIGVVVGTALMQTLKNSIVLLKIPGELEFTIIGVVILIGVVSDELVRRIAGHLRKGDGSTT